MSVDFFVDTNVLVYAHDRGAGPKHSDARELVEGLWRDRAGALSTQVIQEFYVNVRRKARNPVSGPEARRLVEDYLRWAIVVNDGNSVLEAIDLETRFRLSFWDALIVQAARASGASILYSEDLSDRQDYGGVRVINPFTIADTLPTTKAADEDGRPAGSSGVDASDGGSEGQRGHAANAQE